MFLWQTATEVLYGLIDRKGTYSKVARSFCFYQFEKMTADVQSNQTKASNRSTIGSLCSILQSMN